VDFGLGLMGYPGCWDDAAFAEQHGFSTAGFVDSPLLAIDPFVCMALAARTTSTMRLGTLLTVPGLRLATTTASALAGINAVAPGRVFFGAGTGFTGRLCFGLQPLAASKLGAYASAVRDLLAGEEVVERIGDVERRVRLKHSESLRVDAADAIPVYIAADGPKALTIVGEVGDGLITTLQYASGAQDRPAVFANGLAMAGAAAAEQGRSFDDVYTIYSNAVCILEQGESAASPRALAMTGPITATLFHAAACVPGLGEQLPPPFRDGIELYEKEVLSRFDGPRELLYQEIHEGHLTHLLDGEAAVLTEEMIRALTLTGTADEIADQLRGLERAGVKNVSFWVPPRHMRETIVAIEQQIMPLMTPATT
jgi:5,10-methylenetetrahydromethanopterin reductase